MAIDEVLLATTCSAILRFYRWNEPSVSFGYFGRYREARAFAGTRPIVRRWTGGGIVFHAHDVTYSVIVPASDSLFGQSSPSIYEEIHRAIRDVLVSMGQGAELSAVAAIYDRRQQMDSAVADRRHGSAGTALAAREHNKNECFANPVRADVLLNGRKIAGAAHRRTRAGLLHQGSIQCNRFGKRFRAYLPQFLSSNVVVGQPEAAVLRAAETLAAQKYQTEVWLHRF
jgi:lipoate-protein ligase A